MITDQHSVTENANDTNIPCTPKQFGIHSQWKHMYRNTFGESNIQYHDFDNQDSLTFTDKYIALLQQELQNPYWNLHNPITTKNYHISCKAQPCHALLSYPFHNMAAHMEATPTREGI